MRKEPPYLYIIEDERSLYLPADHDRETVLMTVGSNPPTAKDLELWTEMGAQVWRYGRGERAHIGAVDDLMNAEGGGKP